MNTEQRRRNRKGQGELLRQELIAAAAANLRETGDENIRLRDAITGIEDPAVSLRAACVSGCQQTGAIAPGDLHNVATLLWIALHGAATLPQARSSFPWPSTENLLDDLLERVAGLRRA
jgi:hypothetical protein